MNYANGFKVVGFCLLAYGAVFGGGLFIVLTEHYFGDVASFFAFIVLVSMFIFLLGALS